MSVPITLGAEITLRHEENSCYLKASGNNEQPGVRVETGLPLLGFEKCVFAFVRESGGSVAANTRPLAYGSVVHLFSPVTKCAAVVLKTEQSDGSVGLKVVMRPLDERSSVFRIQPKFKSRNGSEIVMHNDSIVLMVENTDLFLCVGEAANGLEIVASSEPSIWTVNRYDRGVQQNMQGVVLAGRVFAMVHRAHQTLLVNAPPTIPAQKKISARRHTLWQSAPAELSTAAAHDDSTRNRHHALLDVPTTDVYFVAGQLEAVAQEEVILPSGSLWIAENVDPAIGGPLVAGERYRFRHFVTGRYLAVRRVASATVEHCVSTMSVDEPQMLDWSLWEIESSSENEFGFLSSYHSYVRLRHCATGNWLGAVNDDEFGIVPSLPTQKTHSRDRLVFRHAPKETEADLFFMMAQLEILDQFAAHFYEMQDFPRTAQRVLMQVDTKRHVSRTQDAIVALISFCTLGENQDFDKSGMPDPIKQKRFTELSAIEKTLACILAPFQAKSTLLDTPIAGGVFTLSDIHRKELGSLYTLLKWAFKLLRQITVNNPDAAKVISPYVDVLLFIESCNVPLGGALQAVAALCDNASDPSFVTNTLEKLLTLNVRSRHSSYIDAVTACVASPSTASAVVALLKKYAGTLASTSVELGRLIVFPEGEKDDRSAHDTAMPIEMFIAHGDVNAVQYFAASVRLLLGIARNASQDALEFCQSVVSREEITLVLSCGFRDAKAIVQADAIKATYAELAMVLYLAADLEASHQPRVMVVSTGTASPSKPLSVSVANNEGPFVRQMKHLSMDVMRINTQLVLDQPGRNALLSNCLTVWHMFVKAHLASPADLSEMVPLLLEVLDGETDLYSLVTTADVTWDRYMLSEENWSVVKTKVEVCNMLHTFFVMCCDQAVGEVVKSVGSGAGADVIYKLAKAELKAAIEIVDLPRLYRILLDCTLYQSADLRRAATNLLSEVLRLTDTVARDICSLHLLTPKHTESYGRIVELVGAIQLGTAHRADADRVDKAFVAIGQLGAVLHNLMGTNAPASVVDLDPHENVTNLSTGSIEYLDLLRMWDVHTKVLALLPKVITDENVDKFARCTEFLYYFCHNEENQNLVAPQWSVFFDAMEKRPAELQRCVLQLLSKTWAKGNLGCPAERRDIRIVLSMYSKDESAVDALRALVALLNTGVPSPEQQRHVMVLLQEYDIMNGQWWMTRAPLSVVYLTRLLELCCTGNNTFTRRLVQQKFPIPMVLRIISASSVNRIGFKTALVRFLASVHFCEEEDSSTHAAAQNAKLIVQDENFWRLLRDDFLVRFEEVSTGGEVNKAIRPYVLEVALCLEAFFRNRFAAGLGNRVDWVLKELRGTLTTVTSMLLNLEALDFNVNEKKVFISLAKAIADAAATINDPAIGRLKTVASTVQPTPNRRGIVGTEDQSKEEKLLEDVKALFRQDFIGDDATFVDSLLPIVRPQNVNDKGCWRRRVLRHLLAACAVQDFDSTAIVTVLTLCRRCIETAPKGRALALQVLFENIGALRCATILMDAVNSDIVLAGIRFGIAVIDNGAREVQNNFLHYMESNDEKFFLALKRCVDKAQLELLHWRRLIIQSASHTFDLRSSTTCFSYVCKVLRFVQLMCEGHHHGMQEYIREQKDNLRSVNALQVTLTLLRALLAGDIAPFEEEVMQCLELLTEFCQGPCVGNQSLLISSNVCSMLNFILVQPEPSSEVKQAAVTTLVSLLEGCTDALVAESVLRQVPLTTLENVFMRPMASEEDTELVFGVGILLRMVADLLSNKPALQYPIQQVLKKRKDVGSQTGRLQVERGEVIESVYFRIPAACLHIGEESKHKLLWNVDRSSQSAKHSSFYELCDDLILELDLMRKQQQLMADLANRYLPSFLMTYITNFEYSLGAWVRISLLLALAVNLLFLADYEDSWLVTLLSVAQLIVSSIIMYIDWSVDGAVHFHKYKKDMQQRIGLKSQDLFDVVELTISKRQELIIRTSRGRSRFCAMQLLASALSVVGFPQLLMTHLFWVITLSPNFANVIAAITQNAKTLSLTIVLGLLFSYGFSVVGFYMFPEDFDNDSDANSHENCSSLMHCFLFIVTTGLRQGGGIGDVMREKSWRSEYFFARKAFDFLFFAVMIIVFLNILFGIIIDTFAELRDAKTRKEEDMRLKCFICGIDSHVFDRHGEGFVWHTKSEHNLWQYLYFIYHLRLKDPNDYTGQESYIAQLLDKKDFSFFPTRSLSLESKGNIGTMGEAAEAAERPERALIQNTGAAVDLRGGQPVSLTPQLQEQFDAIRTTVRRVIQRNMLAEGNAADAQYRVTRTGDGKHARQSLDVATQTHMSESVATLQYELTAAEIANSRLREQMNAMKLEMKNQVEELWKLKVTNLSASELSSNIHTLKNEVKDLQRMLVLVTSEKETVLRQNAFLQDEADRLTVALSKQQVASHLQPLLTNAPARTVAASTDLVQEMHLDRSRLYESLQLSLPSAINDEMDETH